MFGEVFDMTLYDFQHAHSDHSVITELFFYDFICPKIRNFLSIEINANTPDTVGVCFRSNDALNPKLFIHCK